MSRQAGLARGLWGVLATPFDPSGARVDGDSLRRQLELLRSVGSRGVVALGVFGEAARLDADERSVVAELVAAHAGRLEVVLGLPELTTPDVVTAAQRLTAAATRPDPILMVQVNRPAAEELRAHLRAVHEASGARLVVQDYPAASGVTIAAAVLADAIDDLPFVTAVKSEAPPTSAAIAALTARSSVPVFGGLGGLGLLDELMAGAAGAMTGFSFPEGLAATLAAFDEGGYEAARRAYLPWLPLVNFEAQAGIGLAIRKRSLRQRGVLTSEAVRPPGLALPPALVPLLDRHLAALPLVATDRSTWALRPESGA